MALYKLSDGTSSVDISPIRGLNIAENRIRQTVISKEGLSDTHEWGNAELYEVPLINLTKVRADKLLEWWLDLEVLTFTPDQGAPATTYQMIIDGIERPLDMWLHRFDDKYAGTLRLYEVSSQSFSSSYISVSKSRSCSSGSNSKSTTFNPSLSCSAYVLGVSRSSSVGQDPVEVIVEDASCTPAPDCEEIRVCSTWSSSYQDTMITYSSCSDSESCESSQSCSDSVSVSVSTSTGVIEVTFGSQSCSLNPSSESYSESVQGESCSESAGGIS